MQIDMTRKIEISIELFSYSWLLEGERTGVAILDTENENFQRSW